MLKEIAGEFIGTLVLVLFGCGAVAAAVLFNALGSLPEVALVWGIGVALAIYVSRHWCPAHLNPAVSLAMVMAGEFPLKKLGYYWLAQLSGAFTGSAILYGLFNSSIVLFENQHGIVRGETESVITAQFFGEFFPNPGFIDLVSITPLQAAFAEGFGTFLLVFILFKLVARQEKLGALLPLLVGLTVTIIICLIAPFTQAGINPARDFGPRLFAFWAGWEDAAFPEAPYSFFYVYILGPLLGAVVAYFTHKLTKTSS